jgi:hypothetical protein
MTFTIERRNSRGEWIPAWEPMPPNGAVAISFTTRDAAEKYLDMPHVRPWREEYRIVDSESK